MKSVLHHFDSKFACPEIPHWMFYAFDVALRFDLGGDETPNSRPLKRFIQAFERAETVCERLFANSGSVWLLSSNYGPQTPKKKRLNPYKLCGLPKSSFRYLGAMPPYDEEPADEPDIYRHWDAVELQSHDQLKEVLWLALGADLGIRPALSSQVYIVDFQKTIAVHPYDDRGMDVVAADRDSVSDIYRTYNSWLLDYDRPRMQAIFA